MNIELTQAGPLLDGHGRLAQVGWARGPLLECNLENARFYYNRKLNCLPASGYIHYGSDREMLSPGSCLGSLDWGRGVWEYRSFWNWASASGFLADRRSIGLNFGKGFGDLSRATENCVMVDGCVHKLDQVCFGYTTGDYMNPWRFTDNQGRLDLVFTPFKERVKRTTLGLIESTVHQEFGRYSGWVVLDSGETVKIHDQVGFAEEHHARW